MTKRYEDLGQEVVDISEKLHFIFIKKGITEIYTHVEGKNSPHRDDILKYTMALLNVSHPNSYTIDDTDNPIVITLKDE